MPTLDVSRVTRTYINLLENYIQSSTAWPPGQNISVVPQPPDTLEGNNTLGFYLYHITEDSHGKNTYRPGLEAVPVRFTPMPLNLFYLLSAHSDLGDDTGTYREQLIMGLAMKALHDFPVIDDETVLNGSLVLDPNLRGDQNRLRIVLEPTPNAQAVNYWTAGSSPLRLALYYQVSVVMLEPEEVQRSAGRVLSYGVFTFTAETPRIDSTENLILFTIPGENDPRAVELRPAQVTYDAEFTVRGSSLGGVEGALLLRRADWEEAVEVDPAWDMEPGATQLRATVRTTASGMDIVPGIYAAAVRVTRYRTMVDGTSRAFEYVSNESPFAIVPRIDSMTAPDGDGIFTVTGTLFEHPDFPPEAVVVHIAENRLAGGAAGSLDPGQYAVVDATRIEVRLPAGLLSGQVLLFRLIVNGAESAPRWVIVP